MSNRKNRNLDLGRELSHVSRRDVLRVGGLLIPATALPGLFSGSAWAATVATTFDFYISTTGSDSNSGSLASPWSITAINTKQSTYAGKRVGIIAGTYDVSHLMNPTYHTPALNINGGSSSAAPTYIGSSDTSGRYSPRAVTLDAKGSSGSYAGGSRNLCSIIGQGFETNVPANTGNWVLDGLKLTGFSLWAIHVGNYDATGGSVPNVTIQNCEIFGGNAQSSSVASGVNLAPLVIYTSSNCLVDNCYFHDNAGWSDSIHFGAIYAWGLLHDGSNLTIQRSTFVNTGTLYGKEGNIYGSTIQQCYIDMTSKTPSGGQVMGIEGWCNAGGTGRAPSTFKNNIIVGGNAMVLECQETPGSMNWFNSMSCHNNTWILGAGGVSGGNVGYRFWENAGQSKLFSFYNNLFYDNGITSISPYGYVDSNTDGFSVCDYNVYGSIDHFTTRGPGGNASSGGSSQSFASWRSAIGGLEAHSKTNTSNPFTNNGGFAAKYQVQSGSAAYQAGRVGGVSSGAVCNVGAWDGTVSSIGCNFTAGSTMPAAPALSIS